ncbi:CHAT domain-containing protein [Coleofasciculus sp. FACHB-SPT36]|uniref:nSTAND1 domain-containing NTPase n=1 Tax=Cyanophyceae TaxID=3028117 RepID=UPI00168A771B|nr:CHAT domain-containing protein [Coleofasciculus sp. FACHB-SPT36]MBD2538185.1 PD40 domain-containing protein [Coleofasciculus sp. FACHB-SPT36]
MEKLVILDIDGDLHLGAVATLEIRGEGNHAVTTRAKGKLPPANELVEQYEHWQSLYRSLSFLFRLEERGGQITQGSPKDLLEACRQSAQTLADSLAIWLKAESFRPIREKLLEKLLPTDTVRLILQIEDSQLRRLPWHLWDFFERYPKAEVALGATAYERVETDAPLREKPRILAILGNGNGIDIEADRQLLSGLLDDAEIVFLVEPQRRQLYQQLWDSSGWDILFFAGHSSSLACGETGEIEINGSDRLSITELTYALKRAIERGLQLAVFNSCDGLGLARSLESLHIPQIVVMREPVPDLVAQEFLKYFLAAFSRGESFYTSVREAREQLQALEDRCPCASWLPVICQNPTAVPIIWQGLHDRGKGSLEGYGHGSAVPVQTGQDFPCPYRGLSAFQEADAPFFFGREVFTEKLLKAVYNQPLVATIGPSGSGKSSAVFAGLIPRLRQIENWLIVSFRPGNRPFLKLAEQLIPLLEPQLRETDRLVEINKLATAIQQGDLPLIAVLERILDKTPTTDHLLLFADQFEELYALCQEAEIRQRFQDELLTAVNQIPSFTLILTLRADFCEYALSYHPFASALQRFPPEFLGQMSRLELQAAIAKPAQNLGVQIEEGLRSRILDAVSCEPGSLPLLEFALTLLWEQQCNGILTHAAYDAIGGVEQALASYAEQVYAALKSEEQQQAKRIFLQLVHPGEGTADTRRIATRTDVGQDNWNLVTRLADARLVVTRQDEATSVETVEIVHEALIREWQRLRQWLEDNRSFRTWQERLRIALRQWDSQQDEGVLWRGAPLLEAQHWYAERSADLSSTEQTFIQASLALQAREQRVRDRQRRQVILGLTSGLIGLGLLVGIATKQWQRAETGEIDAQLNALSASSDELLASNKELEALLESLKAGRQLQQSIEAKPDTRIRVVTVLQQAVYGVREYNRLEGHQRTVISLSFSPDGQTIASASDDGTVKLWQPNGTLLRTLEGHRDKVKSVSFSPDSQMVASASYDKTVKLWHRDGTLITTLKGHAGKVNSVAFSPDGQFLASASADKTVKLWRRNGSLIVTLKGHRSWVTSIHFSPDSQTLATASTDKTIRLWHRNGKLLGILKGHTASVNSVSFSPDGQTLASASADTTVKLWRQNRSLGGFETRPYRTFTEHKDLVWAVNFSPDGQTLASAGADKTVQLWRLDGTLVSTLKGHSASIYSVSFSPDGQSLASASADTTVKLWHPNAEKLPTLQKHDSEVRGVSFSPDGQTLVSASADKTVRLWHQDGKLLKTLKGHNGEIYSISFSPDGQTFASASADKTIKLWHKDGTLLKTFQGHTASVLSVRFSPDGQTLASASADRTVKLWNRDGTLLDTLIGHQESVTSVSFSPDGQTLASVSADETVKLWHNGSLLSTLPGHSAGILDVSFSPNGSTFASASADGIVKLWSNGQLLKTLTGHTNRVNSISFSPNGQTLASASSDGTVKLWSLSGKLLKTLRGHTDSVLGISFSPDGQTIASASSDRTIILWNLDLDALLVLNCAWMRDYLQTQSLSICQ